MSLKSARLIGAFIFLSRLLGLVREQLLAALLAAGAEADAFFIAFRIPNLLRDLFADGALSAAFVPTFTRVDEQQGRENAYALGQRVFGVLFVVVGLLTVVGYLAVDPLVTAMAPGFERTPGKLALTASLTQVMLPFLLLVSFAAVAMGMLNAQRIFGPPAFAPSAFNLVAICGGVLLAYLQLPPARAAWGWSLGVVVGGAAQFLVQLPALRRAGFRFRLLFSLDDDVKRMLKLMAPATIGLSATQLSIFVNSNFSSEYDGANAYLGYAFRLLYLPIGLFGVAIATVSTTNLSRQVATGDLKAMRKTVRGALSMLAFLTVPSSIGLWVLAEPIVAMIFQRRAFLPEHTTAVAQATAFYALGLFAYSSVKVLAPVYFAKNRARVPLYASLAAVGANLLASYFLRRYIGFLAMAAGLSVGAWVNVIILYLVERAPAVDDEERAEKRTAALSLLRVAMAGALMGGAGYLLLAVVPAAWRVGEIGRWGSGLGLVGVCGLLYLVAAMALRVPEAAVFTGMIRRRLLRRGR